MARVQFNADEIDQNLQIEDGIRQTLNSDPTASVELAVIESCYDAIDAGGSEIGSATVHDKCEQIANALGVQFTVKESLVIFRPPQNAS